MVTYLPIRAPIYTVTYNRAKIAGFIGNRELAKQAIVKGFKLGWHVSVTRGDDAFPEVKGN